MNIASPWFVCASLECSEISPVPALQVTQRGFPENFGIVVLNVPPAVYCNPKDAQEMFEEFLEELLKTIRGKDPKPVFVALPIGRDGLTIPDSFIKELKLWGIGICDVASRPHEFGDKVDGDSIISE